MYKHLICPLMGGTDPKTVTQIKLSWLLSCRGETTLRTETVMIDFFFTGRIGKGCRVVILSLALTDLVKTCKLNWFKLS